MSGQVDLRKVSVASALVKYAVPSTISVWVFALYTMVDGMFVGKGVGPEALAAVNLSLPFISIMFAFSILVSIGGATVAGVLRGKGQGEEASKVFSTCIYFLLAFGLAVCGISLVFVEELAMLLGAQGDLIPLVVEYLGTLLFFNAFYLVAYSMEVFIKVDGYPRRELAIIMVAATTNIVLDYILVIELGMGLRGAAIATGMAQLLQAIVLVIHYRYGGGTLKFMRIKPDLKKVMSYIRIGVPDCITEMSAGVVLLAFNSAILAYLGNTSLTAFSVIGYFNNFVLLTMIGLTQGMQPIITFQRGRKGFDKMGQALKMTLKVALVFSVSCFFLGFLAGDVLASMFLNEPDIIALSHEAMKIFAMGFIFVGMNVVISGFFTALEKPILAGVLSLLRGVILVLVLLAVLPKQFGSDSIWLVAPLTEAITFCVGLVLLAFERRSWHKPDQPQSRGPVLNPA
ncbi:MATE family efflux transporter [Parendozoicomonas haliclonae]|uniref:Multidrug export protein MepA n=1 Tax=Parendozoicomonas haliclonae TaxID=1960125 RepID=A0A1X7AP93_9GAMM|nr:MATE family efflux transporter [Parendozoicomonas haliclonae]SMA50124.1 Multidrug export protein MepA [Parendozoicomonas haliclonae]